jgi:hypothetical protein
MQLNWYGMGNMEAEAEEEEEPEEGEPGMTEAVVMASEGGRLTNLEAADRGGRRGSQQQSDRDGRAVVGGMEDDGSGRVQECRVGVSVVRGE